MAAFAASWVVPSIVGPLAAGSVTEQLGWRWVFLGIPVAGRVPAGARAARDTATGVRARPTAPSPRPSTGAGSGWRWGSRWARGCCSTRRRTCGWLSLLPAVAGAALLVPAVLGLLPRGTYRAARGLPSVVLLRGVAAGSFIAAESFVPLMLVTQRGLSPTLAGLSLAAGGATWALGSFVQSRARLEPYRERLMGLGMVLVAAAIAAAPSVLIEAVPVWTLAVDLGVRLLRDGAGDLLHQRAAAPALRPGGGRAPTPPRSRYPTACRTSCCWRRAARRSRRWAAARSRTPPRRPPAPGSHPAAFAAVFLPMAGVALVGAWVTTRVRAR